MLFDTSWKELIIQCNFFKNATFAPGEEIQYEPSDLFIEVCQKVIKSVQKFSYSTIGSVNGFLTKALAMMKTSI